MPKADKKRPWLKFYPQDWRGDPKLRMCSIGARGLWAEMICLMHEAEPYGHLLVNNVPVTVRQLASLAGIAQSDCMKFMAELESSGVYSRTDTKTIFSRRMVRDAEKSLEGKKHIGKRWPKGDGDRSPIPTLNRGPNRSPSPDPITLEAISQIDDDETHARAACAISQEAFDITDALEKAFGFNLPEEIPPGWCGCAMWTQKCLDQGWTQREMVWAGKVIAKRARRPIISFNYLEKPMAELIAEHRRPLPEIEVKPAEKLTVTANGKQQSGNVIQAADRLLDKVRSFDALPGDGDGIRDGTGPASPRLLSQG